MRIQIDKKGKATVLHISGNLDADTVAQFKKTIQPIVDGGCFAIVMDCQSLHFIDSMGLGALISLLRKVRTHQGDLKIAGLNSDVRSVFEITRLHRLFEIHPNWETACENFL